MTGFLKIILLLTLIGAVAFVASVDVGQVTITWFKFKVETTGIVLVLVMALVTFISMGFMRLMLSLAGVPEHVAHWREKRAWAKKEADMQAATIVIEAQPAVTKKAKARGKK